MNDHQLRRALKSKVLARYAKDPDTRVVEELGLRHGLARVDVAVVNGIIHGYELKSDKDNLKRLPHQIQVYSSELSLYRIGGELRSRQWAALEPLTLSLTELPM